MSRVWSVVRRVGAVLAWCAVCFFCGDAASWATTTPAPMPSPYGVADSWACETPPSPSPAPDPPVPVVESCAVTSWATPAPVPTVTATATVTATPTPEPVSTDPAEVVLAPAQWDVVAPRFDVLIFGVGGLLMLALLYAVWHYSTPATFGSRR